MPFEQPSEKQKKEAKEYWEEDMYELAGHYRRSISQEERRKKERGEPQEKPETGAEERAGKEGERVETVEALRRSEIEKRTNELFGEKEKELQEKIDKPRTFQGERLSPSRAHEETLKFYLTELGYSVKYTALHNRARILNEKGEYILDKKTKKPIEFKTSFDPKGETPIIKFLKEELKHKIRKDLGGETEVKEKKEKPAEKDIDIEKLKKETEKAYQKAGFKTEYKKGPDFLGAFNRAFEKVDDSIKKGARRLAVLGLTPVAVIEDTGRRVFAEPRKFFEKVKAGRDAGRAMEKGEREELDKIYASYSDRIKQIEEQKKKKSKIWELIKKIRI